MRLWNFAAGPATLPEVVLEQVRDELLDWHGAGCSIMELSHRGKEFSGVIAQAEEDMRELMGIPQGYKVLFLQGGATQQFSQIPLNLLAGESAAYVVTGSWSKKAYKEAQRFGAVTCAASTEAAEAVSGGFTRLPAAEAIQVDERAAYVHVCTNETIHGVEVFDSPRLLARVPASVPVVADMSSHILSRPMAVEDYGLIYAGAQKNIGPSGLTLVIVREDLIGRAGPQVPALMDYRVQADNGSMLNTPPTFSIYVAGLVFKWIKAQGGVAGLEKVNRQKADLLYRTIDNSGGFYRNPVAADCRSLMNVPFTLADPALDSAFLAQSKEAGLLALKGHKSVGGMRASIYNALPLAGVQALVSFMEDFAKRNG